MDFDEASFTFELKDKKLFKQQCFINGEWIDAETGETFEVYNPSDQKLLGYMPNCSKAETIRAIDLHMTLGRAGEVYPVRIDQSL